MNEQVDATSKFDPAVEIPAAISLLKRSFMKVAKVTRGHTSVVVPAEAVAKLARAIDPAERLYPDPIGNFIFYNGVAIVAEESGEAGLKEASAWMLRKLEG